MIKKVAFCLAFIFTAQSILAAGFEKVLTEDSSVQTALAINHDIMIHSQNVEYARQRINESRSLYFPKIDLNFNISKFNNSEPMMLFGAISPSPVHLPSGNKDIYYSTRLAIWHNVYSGGRVKTTNKLAEINMDKIKNEENLVKTRVINNVKCAFNECLYYKEQIKFYLVHASKTARNNKNENIENTYKLDVAQYNYEKALLNLLNAIGLELNTIVDVAGDFSPKIKNLELNQCILLAYQFKPEMQGNQYQETIDGLMVNLLSMQRFPTVSIGAAQEWLGDRLIGDESNWYVTINANIPIFDGGSGFARVKQGRIDVREATLKRSKTEEEIRLQVSKTFLDYSFWKQQAAKVKLLERAGEYTESDLELIYNINKSYYALELAIGVQLDLY